MRLVFDHQKGNPSGLCTLSYTFSYQEQIPVNTLEPNLANPSASSVESIEAGGGSKMGKTDSDQDGVYYDPITYELMCDPVKGNDGHTYDRWTIIDHSPTRSPFDQRKDKPFFIACDDLNVRSALFEKFQHSDGVIDTFHERRRSYRDRAIGLATQERREFDALKMLSHILEWDPEDSDCKKLQDDLLDKITKSDQSLLFFDGSERKSFSQRENILRLRVSPSIGAGGQQLRRSSISSSSTIGIPVIERSRSGGFEFPVSFDGIFGCLFGSCCVCFVMCCLLCIGNGERDGERRDASINRREPQEFSYRFHVGNM